MVAGDRQRDCRRIARADVYVGPNCVVEVDMRDRPSALASLGRLSHLPLLTRADVSLARE